MNASGAKRADEAALVTSDGQLRTLIDHAPVALAMFDEQMRYLAASRRWLEDYGLQGQAVLGRSYYEVFQGIDARWREVHRRCLAGATERCDEDHFERADGSVQWLRWEALPWYRAGRIGGIVILTEDITERRNAVAALAESEARFRATFEQAAVGIAHQSLAARWLRVNRRLCEIIGYDRDELLGRSFDDFTHPADIEADHAQRARLIAGELDHFSLEERYLRKVGDQVWVRVTVSLRRHANGQPDYFIAVVEDIDGRRRADETLKKLRSEMEQLLALHVAAQTAVGIAHDLNQPLSAVTYYAEAARRMLQAQGPVPERVEHALHAVREQAQRAAGVVRDLLQFLRRGQTSSESLDLNALVRESIAILESDDLDGFAQLRLADNLRPVQADRMQVEKVLVNLMRNAVEAMRRAGVAPAAIRLEVATAAADGHALVTVRDFGPGLDAETAGRLFEPFFSSKPDGIGMGLAVSRALVEAHGGRLWCEPVAAAGAVFRFTLPFAP